MGSATMEAIKRQMQAMKMEKENAHDKADQLDQKLSEQKVIYEKVYYFIYLLYLILVECSLTNI